MSIPSTLKYLFTTLISCVLLVMAGAAYGQASADTAALADTLAPEPKHKDTAGHQLTLGFDIVHPVENYFNKNQQGYEFAAEYYLHNEIYAAAEGGWGSSSVDYSDLKYSTKNSFYRIGLNKILLARDGPADWGGMFMGLRLGFANIQRSAATYTVVDSLWGNSTGAIADKTLNSYWMEINGGVRVELVKGLMAGWTVRGKFMLNSKQLQDLAPLYIAGYGRGDKNAVFDFNFYVSYAIRWKRAHVPPPLPGKAAAMPGK